MKLGAYHSHLNGLEYLLVHKPDIWQEIQGAIEAPITESAETPEEFEVRLQKLGWEPGGSQRWLIKERIGLQVALEGRPSSTWELLARPLAFYTGDVIDLGVEIVPMNELHDQMSLGVPYYESELYNLIREGRGVPAVPLVLIGVVPQNARRSSDSRKREGLV